MTFSISHNKDVFYEMSLARADPWDRHNCTVFCAPSNCYNIYSE